MSEVRVSAPRFEHHREALGIGESRPRLSWRIAADAPFEQAAYEIEGRWPDGDTKTHAVESREQVLVDWPFPALASRERVEVRVRVRPANEKWSAWSEWSAVEAGLLHPEDWQAVPVGPAWDEDPEAMRRPALVRRDFTLNKPVVRARLYVTAHGVYEVEINGQ